MTKEDAKQWILEHMPPDDDTKQSQVMAVVIKALEQEPILDKIRTEIDNELSDGMIHKQTVLGIIDKYKAESEG